jgi:hypothetical protein
MYGVSQRERNIYFFNKTYHLFKKVLIFLFQYKVHTLRLIVEHNIRQMSPTTLLAHTDDSDAHFKSFAVVGTPYKILIM